MTGHWGSILSPLCHLTEQLELTGWSRPALRQLKWREQGDGQGTNTTAPFYSSAVERSPKQHSSEDRLDCPWHCKARHTTGTLQIQNNQEVYHYQAVLHTCGISLHFLQIHEYMQSKPCVKIMQELKGYFAFSLSSISSNIWWAQFLINSSRASSIADKSESSSLRFCCSGAFPTTWSRLLPLRKIGKLSSMFV